jgi:hypothetical protein
VKQIQNSAGGDPTELIVPVHSWRRWQRFDKFPRRGGSFGNFNFYPSVPGPYYSASDWYLLDTLQFYYVCPTPLTLDQAEAQLQFFLGFTVKNYPGFWFGEAYNDLIRSTQTQKMSPSQFHSFLGE